jgi:lipopolysaccharide/colanic/teichoic acid biosynthesis glycosyltransferase
MFLVAAEPMTLSTAIGISERATLARSSVAAATYAAVKRALDILVASVFLLALLPMFALIAVAIVWDNGWPFLYRGERIGRDGRAFRAVKFRSMRAGCDQTAHVVFIRGLIRGESARSLYKVPGDARVTRVGAFLRKTSLDELPQLWIVLGGEMSLVGPRPDVAYAVAEYADWMHRRLAVKPGITGLWQVSGRSRLGLLDMYRLDVSYADNASLLQDVSILVRTVPVVLGRDGAG